MRILVDADACPVVDIIEELAAQVITLNELVGKFELN